MRLMGARMSRPTICLLVATLLATLSGCGGADKPQTAAAPSAAPQSPSAESQPSPAPTVEQSPSPEPVAAGAHACTDKAGDAKGPLDLRTVKLSQAGDQLLVTWTTSTAPPQQGTVLWSVNVSSADGSTSRQLGLKILDGSVIGHFVFDNGTAQQDNVSSAAMPGRSSTADFPLSAVSDLGAGAKWRAGVNVAGDDSDACPDPGSDLLNQAALELPGAWVQ